MRTLIRDDLVKEFDEAYPKWENKFSFMDKDKPASEAQYYDNNHWGHIWTGPAGEYCGKEVIPGVTIVYGSKVDRKFIQPEEFMEKFQFTDLHPISSNPSKTAKIPSNPDYYMRKALEETKQTIRDNAALRNRMKIRGNEKNGERGLSL